jgi:hypothetical protein
MKATRAPRNRRQTATPEVIVDVLFDQGLLFLAIRNISLRPAYDVSVEFDPPITRPEDGRPVASLPLFRDLAFLAPGREITTFLDTSASYFRRGQPTRLTARVAYRDVAGRRATATIQHNLEIYREARYVRRGRALEGE